MRQDWLSFAQAAVPRYTSYPTAVQFHNGVAAAEASDWAGMVRPGKPISVYVHVPFCEQLCWYCGCHTSVPNGYERISRYVDFLHQEVDLWSRQLGAHGGVKHLHFGGGSPNALSASDFVGLVNHIEAAFTLRPDAEIAVEIDPRALTPERIAALAISGVSRASLGVQTLAPHVQKAINRVQPQEMIETTLEDLRKAGIGAINMDLMYGLPQQTVEDVVEAARFAASMGTDRVAVFGYAHVPWFAKHQRAIEAETLPGLVERFHQAEAVGATLMAAGYSAIGLDHFARPGDEMAVAAKAGRLRRNFQGYTTDPCETLIGLGQSSISAFHEGYVQNTKDRRAWEAAIASGALPSERGIDLVGEDRLHARAIEMLMCNLAVDAAAVCREMGVSEDRLDASLERARLLEAAGLCVIRGRQLEIPEEARALMRTVARCFDAYVPAEDDAPRHAKAV
ncbi:oxygen-independent coproporphyrinogen III oxidase [Henriciella aquimarina]|uniref:oxygen-independent coproporphyrinogen III oxidase n=1 Tax=Henriciella aquimarina TaxID=545261 RepID=UPI000A0396C9|nr:oxygen-independent coproporphyrinogen III oxidase [Henriciella aquimarina]